MPSEFLCLAKKFKNRTIFYLLLVLSLHLLLNHALTKPVEDGMVDNLVEKKVQFAIIYLPSFLHAIELKATTMSLSDVVRLMQRKVYKDANYGTLVTEVLATCLNDNHEVLGHAMSSTSSGRRQKVLSIV